jgi:phage terminase large subunit GpA-like protein
LSQWSALHARLDNGKRFRAFPFQDGIADAFSDPATEQVTVKKSSRIGYSQIVQNYIGWCISQSPRRLLIYQPTIDDAEKYSRDDLEPVLLWPAVKAVATFKPRDRNNQVRAKRFKGGWIQIKGANSPKEFRRVTTDSVLLEEPDGYPFSAGPEGDPARLAFKRNQTSDEPLSAAGSTPTLAGFSRIDALFVAGTQEHRYVPCPHCGHMQVLVWGDGTGAGIRWEPRHQPTRAWYRCENGCDIDESHKAWMDGNGEWRAHAPENGPRHRSFHIWSAYSQHRGAGWLNLAREFLEVRKDPNLLKTFVNQVLGEVWEETGEAPEWQRLYERREASMALGTPPAWAGLLVGAADVQRANGGRIELDVWAFGPGRQRALVEHIEVEGSIADKRTWAKLDEQVSREWRSADGRRMRLARVGIDSGDGENTMQVYAWARKHPGFAMALKGRETLAAAQPIAGPTWKDLTINGRTLKKGVRLWTVGTSMLKLELYGQLQLDKPVDGDPYPDGYVFLPNGTTDEWIKQLVSEQLVMVKRRTGRMHREWRQTRPRNEALDMAVYARAVAIALGVDRWSARQWEKALGLRLRTAPPPAGEATEGLSQGATALPMTTAPKPKPRRRPNPFTTRGGR